MESLCEAGPADPPSTPTAPAPRARSYRRVIDRTVDLLAEEIGPTHRAALSSLQRVQAWCDTLRDQSLSPVAIIKHTALVHSMSQSASRLMTAVQRAAATVDRLERTAATLAASGRARRPPPTEEEEIEAPERLGTARIAEDAAATAPVGENLAAARSLPTPEPAAALQVAAVAADAKAPIAPHAKRTGDALGVAAGGEPMMAAKRHPAPTPTTGAPPPPMQSARRHDAAADSGPQAKASIAPHAKRADDTSARNVSASPVPAAARETPAPAQDRPLDGARLDAASIRPALPRSEPADLRLALAGSTSLGALAVGSGPMRTAGAAQLGHPGRAAGRHFPPGR